jgi:DNA polymerase I-like protein with 3'-5' exonuclease and polymerase domains
MEWLNNEDERIEYGRRALASLLASRKYDGILALGWFALLNLVGKRGIDEHRGSIYRMADGTPVLGTYHPARLFEEPKLANVIFRDFFKFQRMVTEGVPEPIKRNLVTFPTQLDAWDWWRSCLFFNPTFIAVDIEADPKTKELTEVGFAWSATDAITIKMGDRWAEEFVCSMLATNLPKVFHNASFDVPFLEYNLGWQVNGELHDTLLMHHTIYPEFPADLGFCASLYTDEPYWKDLGGSKDEALRQRYNALDVAVTAELFGVLGKKLTSLGLKDTYERDRSVIRPAIEMSKLGVRYDFEEHKRLREKMDLELGRWQRVLNARAKRACLKRGGDKAEWLLAKLEKENLNAMSPLQAPALLYNVLGLPTQYIKKGKKKKSVTTSQMKLLNLYPNIVDVEAKKTLRALLHVRRIRKMKSTYLTENTLCGIDGRIRTTFGVGRTETGRWSASTFLIDQEGANLQTVPPEWKTCFIADEGKDLFYADYSQIEARIVAYDAEDLDQIAVFERGGDIHRENAARMVKKKPEDVTDDERQYMGKTVHALNYKVGAETLAESINKHGLETGIFISKAFTSTVRQMYLDTYDRVVRWQRRQWGTVKETGILTNHLGRRRIFTGPKKGQFAHVTEGEAIAFVPQSDVPDLLNLAIRAISGDAVMQECGVQLQLQVHDALLGQGDSDKKHIWVPRLRELMTIPLIIRGRQCIVPIDVKVGQNWKGLKKYA